MSPSLVPTAVGQGADALGPLPPSSRLARSGASGPSPPPTNSLAGSSTSAPASMEAPVPVVDEKGLQPGMTFQRVEETIGRPAGGRPRGSSLDGPTATSRSTLRTAVLFESSPPGVPAPTYLGLRRSNGWAAPGRSVDSCGGNRPGGGCLEVDGRAAAGLAFSAADVPAVISGSQPDGTGGFHEALVLAARRRTRRVPRVRREEEGRQEGQGSVSRQGGPAAGGGGQDRRRRRQGRGRVAGEGDVDRAARGAAPRRAAREPG